MTERRDHDLTAQERESIARAVLSGNDQMPDVTDVVLARVRRPSRRRSQLAVLRGVIAITVLGASIWLATGSGAARSTVVAPANGPSVAEAAQADLARQGATLRGAFDSLRRRGQQVPAAPKPSFDPEVNMSGMGPVDDPSWHVLGPRPGAKRF